MDDWSDQVAKLADALTPDIGHHKTLAPSVGIFRADSAVTNIPKFLHPGILFVVQGRKRLCCAGNAHIVDRDHFLLTSAPVAFASIRMLTPQAHFSASTSHSILLRQWTLAVKS
ncbi:AraC family transcriptional regulator N-terminal domain-containing protein [Rhizobium sp. J15]|uniref:AraC family transcriptional regulator N-terminal domain-containing protein n=1 Tax=Rhizobium sp. J15 TaxID=2035450 RepID=UPI0032B00B72